MKAIILAAGEGTRLRPYTLERPKCMVLYRGRSLIEYQVEALRAAGIVDIVVVCGYRAEAIRIPNVRFVRNELYDRTNMVYSLFCAEHELNDDTVVSYGDIIYGSEIVRALLDCRADFCVTVDTLWYDLWQARMEDPLMDAETLKVDADGRIVELGKKPRSLHEIQGQYMGLFMIRRTVLPLVIRHYHAMDRTKTYDGQPFEKMFMTTFLQSLIDKGMILKSVPVRGGWLEIDRVSDLRLRPVRDTRGTLADVRNRRSMGCEGRAT